MALRGNTGTALGIHGDVSPVVEVSLQEEGVGDHADISAETTDLDVDILSVVVDVVLVEFELQVVGDVEETEGELIIHSVRNLGLLHGGHHTILDFPTLGTLDAVLNRKFLSFPGVEVILGVGVPGKEDEIPLLAVYLFYDVRDGLDSVLVAKGSGNEVILAVNNDQNLFFAHM